MTLGKSRHLSQPPLYNKKGLKQLFSKTLFSFSEVEI